VRDENGAEKLVLNKFCSGNLTSYIHEYHEPNRRVGLCVKGCDARALVELLKQKQVKREDVFVIGVPCTGQIDTRKLRKEYGPKLEEIKEISEKKDSFMLEMLQGTREIRKEKLVFDKCLSCTHPEDFEYDIALEEIEIPEFDSADPVLKRIEEIESCSTAEKKKMWDSYLSQCILCRACQKVCYACYCPECIFDKVYPRWFSKISTTTQKRLYHLIRAYHLAGRCIDCGECERACPADIPLRLMNKKIEKEVQKLFNGREAGVNMEEVSPLTTFDMDDPDFFL
jgi:ferredoxin